MHFLSIVFGLIQFLLIIYITFQELKKKSPVVFLWATLIIMFGIPHFLTTIIGDKYYSHYILFQASLFVSLFTLLYIIFRNKSTIKILTLGEHSFHIRKTLINTKRLDILSFVIILISFFITFYSIYRSQGGFLNSSWASIRNVETNYINIGGLTSRLIYTFSGLSLYFFLTNRKKLTLIVLILFLVEVIITRNRAQILPVFIFVILLFIISIKKINLKHILIGVSIAVAAIYIIYAFRVFRYLGTLSNAIDNFSWKYINSKVIEFINDNNGELGLREYFYYFIKNNNKFEGFNRGNTYIRMLLVFIPSKWSFGIKPRSFDLYMGQAIGMPSGGSVHPTLFGDCFGNMNWLGVFLGCYWALLANGLDALICRQKDDYFKIMLAFLSAYSCVIIGRGSVYNGFEVSAWGGLFLLLYWFLFCRGINYQKLKTSINEESA